MFFLITSIMAAILWLAMALLPWRPWSVKESLESRGKDKFSPPDGKGLTVLIPARNEEKTLGKTLEAVRNQGENIRIIVVDDCSSDNTHAVAQKAIGSSGMVLKGKPLPPGWIGKLWALEQGFSRVDTPFVLLIDADILLRPGTVSSAMDFLRENHLDFLSLMARLRMENTVEKFFMPAFVYFFKLLYPFRLSNRPGTSIAAAAGGFILARTEVLREVGAFRTLKDALIDDCTLASKVKGAGFKTWMGLTRSVVSMRRYDSMEDIWRMVKRTAFTQLRYSWILLLLATLFMTLLFLWPACGPFSLDIHITLICIAALLIMCITYLPVLRYYDQPAVLALALPVVATMYMAMTWSSAFSFQAGKGACWKDRCYKDGNYYEKT